MFDMCLTGEELAFGCTGIYNAIESSNLGVSFFDNFWLEYLKTFKRFPNNSCQFFESVWIVAISRKLNQILRISLQIFKFLNIEREFL